MCDFSAKAAKQRAAVQNDHLISRKISTHTIGFASVADPSTAVCLLPGTEIAFAEPPQFIKRLFGGVGSIKKTASDSVARFRQVEKDNERTHHDALEFPGGEIVKLNALLEGQAATVLQLPAAPRTSAEIEEQKRAAYV